MLWTIAVILLVLWALGLVSSFTMGGFIHLLLVAAVVVVAVAVEAARGESPLALLGAYETTGRQHYAIPTVAKWLLWHAG